MKLARRIATLATAATTLTLIASPAHADGNVTCNSGPQSGWQPIEKLKKKVWMQDWQLLKSQIEGDCYEVYAHTRDGMAVEAFFHPVTLEKLVVFRRGKEIYRKPGFQG